ncbi:DUF2255 family protein [Elizabethkingia argentiflava]|uniref:DUF2255 family protein n=1 Tax=Elizabethkingia argenteiflava TaxID=2681556 RepID=A0A845PV84_9FLAO|nr:DUF2255 family protein [Elizabethkingia argenteiflava]NAW51565.1 DUF2255 family protein [Elizabethkingia argenteiflava]
MFPEDFYKYLNNNTLILIKAGTDREKFTEICAVVVEGRTFARSWNKNLIGWFGEIKKYKEGEIRYGDKVLKVKVHKLSKDDMMHTYINAAYREKYNQEYNIEYALAISQPEYSKYTIEFILA